MTDLELVTAIERADAASMAAMAQALAGLDPSWGSSTVPLADGWLVLSGNGLYVNRAIAVGIDAALTADELDAIVAASRAAGVVPEMCVTPATHPDTIRALTDGGWQPDTEHTVAVMTYPADADLPQPAAHDVTVETVSQRSLDEWVATSIVGWGHETPAARRAAEAFARAAHAVDGDGMVIAVDQRQGATRGDPIGCASLTINAAVATLGGMSTVPTARRRGVQSVLIRHRLGVARDADATTIWSSAVAGGDSQRNLLRHGFVPQYERTTYRWTEPDR